MWRFIWVFTVCKRAHLGVTGIERDKERRLKYDPSMITKLVQSSDYLLFYIFYSSETILREAA